MNFAELIYKLVEYFFDSFLHFTQLLLLIFIFNGALSKFFVLSGAAIVSFREKYKAKLKQAGAKSPRDLAPEWMKKFIGKSKKEDETFLQH